MLQRTHFLTLLLLFVLVVVVFAVGLYAKSGGFFLMSAALAIAALGSRTKKHPTAVASTAALCVGLAMAEWLTPLLFEAGPDGSTLVYQDGYRGERTDIGAQPNSGVFKSRKSTATGEIIYDVAYTIGPDHLRVTPNNPAGPYRVNFLGCSYTFGEGLPDNETLPYYFAREAGNVHVKNFGFHGYGAHQALATLESGRDTGGQVNFFLTAQFHAERSACKPKWVAGAPRYELLGNGSVGRNGFCGDGKDMVRHLLTQASAFSNILAKVDQFLRSRINDSDMDLYVALVKRMAILSHERGQRFVVGFLGGREDRFRGTSYTGNKIISEFASVADEVIVLNLTDSWPMQRDHYQIHPTDSHPNARANRERAEILARELKQYLR